MKKLMGILLVIVLALSVLYIPASASGIMGWDLDEDGVLTFYGEGALGNLYFGPDANGYNWLNYSDRIKSVILPDGITIIGDGAFQGCSALESISIPDSVVAIGGMAFWSCTSLKSITIPKNVSSMGGSLYFRRDTNPFAGCKSLEKIIVDKENTVFHSNGNCLIETETSTVVAGCKNSVIPSYVEQIGPFAFEGCSLLKRINIPENVTLIGGWSRQAYDLYSFLPAFGNCSGLEEITVDKKNPVYHSNGNCLIETETNTLIFGCKNSVIPNYVKNIDTFAFFCCSTLESITIPRSVTYISSAAFMDCTSLKLVYIKSSHILNNTNGYSGDGDKYLIENAETIIFSASISATDYIKENYPYTGKAVIDGESVTWFKKTQNCAIHYYEKNSSACVICGEKRETAAFIIGDANGDGKVNNIDASFILQYDAGVTALDSTASAAADADGNDEVNNIDASRLLQLDAGIIDAL